MHPSRLHSQRSALFFLTTVLQPHQFVLLLAMTTTQPPLTDRVLDSGMEFMRLTSAKRAHQTPRAHLKGPKSYTFAQFLLDLKTRLIWLYLILELQGLYVGPQYSKGIPFPCLILGHSL